MKQTPSLLLTNATRLWVAADNIQPPFVNQLIFDGTGSFDTEKLAEAIKTASSANPGSRYVLRGTLGRSRWADSGITPRLRVVDGAGWDGMGPQGAPACISERLYVNKGPSCEVVIIRGNPLRILFRTHHGVMDGRGTMTWAEDIFRALRGEPVIGSDPFVSENELLNISAGKIEKAISYVYGAPTGRARGRAMGITWKRVIAKGSYKLLLPKVMICVARQVWKHSPENARFGISVDMRSRRESLRSTNNLTNAFFIDFGPGMKPGELSELIVRRQKNREDGTYTLEDRLICHTPLWLLGMIMKRETLAHHKSGQYRYSAYVSNMGRVPLESFSGGGFTAESFWGIPPGLGMVPLFLGVGGHADRVELVASMPEVLACDGRLDTLMKDILEELAGMKD
ncbi:MAG TPA: hypothetical protein PK514_07105 [Spirochaetota bacterium]|nr:hypothetical protein [Spirochaetota bacterium]